VSFFGGGLVCGGCCVGISVGWGYVCAHQLDCRLLDLPGTSSQADNLLGKRDVWFSDDKNH